MVLHVHDSKDGKDRDIVLSPHLLGWARKLPWGCSPGSRWHTADYPISDKVVWHACAKPPIAPAPFVLYCVGFHRAGDANANFMQRKTIPINSSLQAVQNTAQWATRNDLCGDVT